MAGASTIGLVSADSHVNEPRDLWLSNLPASMRDQAMRGIEARDDGGWELIFQGRHMAVGASGDDERLLVNDPAHRFAIMREEGIAGECVFPTIGLYVWMLTDPDGGQISCRIYNDWIADQLASRSERFKCAGLVPTWRIDDAVAEIAHIASAGLGAIMLPAVAMPSYNHRDWDPVWAAAAETGLPIVMHQGTGHNMIWYRGPGATVANLLSTQSIGPRTAAMLATSGVLERHPDLHFVFVEYNAGWIAWMMDTIDYYNEAFSVMTTATQGSAILSKSDKPPRPVIYPDLPEKPSFYVRRQIHATFQEDVVALNNLNLTGNDCVMWGSDYPHHEGTYPHSRESVDRLSRGLDDAATAAVFRDNAAHIFNFDPAVLAAPF
ncbi:MAG: amidohydrolase family protein [Acidimicrobiia bacterium]